MLALVGLLGVSSAWAQDAAFTFKKGDRIAVIGNTLADRLQHDAWFDAYLTTRNPELSIRHLGFSGDEIFGVGPQPDASKRLRSSNFGSHDEWMRRVGADVIFAFYGHNESYGDRESFAKSLDGFLKYTLKQKYNGNSECRVVLFSPIAVEAPKGRSLPSAEAGNARLKPFVEIMAKVAKENGVLFVNLFEPTEKLFAATAKPLTINGIHLSEDGNRELAKLIETALFGSLDQKNEKRLEATRQAAIDRNLHWHNRYRATDGYSVFGGRADLKFVGGQTNRVVAQRELEILDVMTANRDKAVTAAALGKEYKLDDSNTPDFIPVISNKPGKLEGGKHEFLDGTKAIEKMTVGQGIKVNLFADEKMFPELQNPVQMAWDPQGRLWVACWPTYPHWKPKDKMNDKLLVLEDKDGDGVADNCTVFAGDLHNPTGFEFYNGGVLVAQAPDLLYLKDTNGDGQADVRQRVLHGLDSADTHHTANSFVMDPGGSIYFQEGTFHHSQVESPYGPPRRVANGAVFKYEPRNQKFDVYVSFGFANPHGHVFDRWGQDIVVDGTGANPYHGILFSGHLPFPQKHARPPQVYQQRTRPCGGIEYMTSAHFPPEFHGNLIVTNCIGFQGVLRYKIEDNGASFKGTELEPFLSSSDPNFRPVDAKVGPDGGIYIADWQNPIIGHMQHNLRDPNRDKEHGRIYRLTHEKGVAVKRPKIAGESVEKLLELLKAKEDRTRYWAKIELGSRKAEEVLPAVAAWAGKLNPQNAADIHPLYEALNVYQHFDTPDPALLKMLLTSPDFHARAAAVRTLVAWRERITDALDILKTLAADTSPRVRLMAVWAASYFTLPEAIEVVLIAESMPKDPFVDFTAKESLKALDPYVKKAIAEGREIKFTTPAGARYFLKNVANDDLLKMKPSAGVYTEILNRKGIRDEARRLAVAGLAKERQLPEMTVLIHAFSLQDSNLTQDESVAFDLMRLITDRKAELKDQRSDFERFALSATTPLVRQLAYAMLVATDETPDKAWQAALKSTGTLKDFALAVPMIRDPLQRAELYTKLQPLLAGLPPELSQGVQDNTLRGRYVRVELPGKQRTLTLAEVEVYSDGRNVARQGKASQSSTAYSGTADHGIDGNTSGNYNDGGQTHTEEGTDGPWWEVDLGRVYPIDRIVIFNRTDGNLGARLKDFSLIVLDADRKVVAQQLKNPAPESKKEFTFSGESPTRVIRRAAMLALTSIRGKERDTFKALAKFAQDDMERPFAIQAIQRIPVKEWPKEDAVPLFEALRQFISKLPANQKTSPVALDAMQFADMLTTLMDPAAGKAARKVLGEIGVRVIRVGTLTDQMLFDKDRIVVQAGKPVEFVFENTDIMPHNFVIVQPGALEEVGNAGEEFATQPGAQAKDFVPPSKKILLQSKLLQPQNSQNLRFTAPTKAGVYPYVCTYPGHWRRMHGALYVVADLDEYLADPEAYVAKSKITIEDKLLEYNRPRKEWTLAELAPAVTELQKGGRSYQTGKQIFSVASCVSCHKFNNEGKEFGPDLAKLDEKEFKTETDILKHLLEPSLRIEDKYRSYTFNLADGGTITGMILEKVGQDFKVIENPLAKAEARTIPKADLDGDPKPSAVSMMPKGLLDKLTKDEILDLLAYIASKGDAKHKYFQGGHGHGHGHGHDR